MESDSGAIGDILHDGEQSFELRGSGDGYVVAERQDLIALALEGIAEECAIDDETAGDSIALRLVTDEFYIHKIDFSFFKQKYGTLCLQKYVKI